MPSDKGKKSLCFKWYVNCDDVQCWRIFCSCLQVYYWQVSKNINVHTTWQKLRLKKKKNLWIGKYEHVFFFKEK